MLFGPDPAPYTVTIFGYVQTKLDSFSCQYEKLSSIVWTVTTQN